MVRWPAPERMSKVSAGIVERFKKAGVAKELEQDPHEWVLMNWPWMPEPPYTVVARATDGEERRYVMGDDELWRQSASSGASVRNSPGYTAP